MNRWLDARGWSLQWRLTAYFLVATTVILCGVAWLLYDHLGHQLWEKDEASMRSTMETQLRIVGAMDSEAGPDLWEREWAEHVDRGKELSFRLVTPDGKVLPGSSHLAIPVDVFPVQTKRRAALKRYTETRDGKVRRYMLASQSVVTPAGRTWLLQAAYDVSESQELIENFAHRLLAIVLSAIVVVSCIAAWLVHRGLAPLRAMSASIAAIDANRLHARIGDRRWPADLRQLADAFDSMLERLEAAFEQLSRFSSDLAHEFRSPITNLVAASGVMLSRARTPAEYQETLALVVEEGDRLSRMVSSMLFLARADHAKQVVAIEVVEVAALLDQIREAYEGVAEEAGLRIEVEGAGRVSGDPTLLRNVLSNLVSNAIHHTPRGGTVSLSGAEADDGTTLSVRDDGAGIASEHLPHIFERFYRADAARSAGDRTGLGLAVASSIAQLHGGRLTVRSIVGEGSTFALWLPTAGAD